MLVGVKRGTSTALTVICVAVTGLGLYNVYGDNAGVVADAQRAACAGQDGCKAELASFSRTPFAQKFSMRTPKSSVEVTCKRSAILVGSYACKVE
jgi:hypothetical protein